MHIWKMPGCVVTGFRIPRWHVNMVQDERFTPLCELISHRNQILRVWVRVRGQRSRGEAACVLQLWPRQPLTFDSPVPQGIPMFPLVTDRMCSVSEVTALFSLFSVLVVNCSGVESESVRASSSCISNDIKLSKWIKIARYTLKTIVKASIFIASKIKMQQCVRGLSLFHLSIVFLFF